MGGMQPESTYWPSAAEFPHDNPEFDRGALWVRSALCFFATPSVSPPPLAPPPAPAPEPTSATAATIATATATPTPSDPLDTFVRVVTEVALAHGPAEIAPHIESLFHFGACAADALSPNVRAALCEGKILEMSDDDVRPTTSFASTRAAWEHILRGESGDLSACGDSTLDSWTADVIACLIASPDKAATIRRDLRRRGIAAFGMLD